MRKTITITTICIFIFSCSNTSNEKIKEHQHNTEKLTIELNSGEKWNVDANMMTHIRNMENDVISFSGAELKDYHFLAKKLQSNVDLLTSNCTMKGKAHDELHKWLVPYIDLVNEMLEVQDVTQGSGHLVNLQKSFKEFNRYFY